MKAVDYSLNRNYTSLSLTLFLSTKSLILSLRTSRYDVTLNSYAKEESTRGDHDKIRFHQNKDAMLIGQTSTVIGHG